MSQPTSRPTVARTPEDVEKLRPVWESHPLTNLDSDLDYFLAVCAANPTAAIPHVLVVPRPATLTAKDAEDAHAQPPMLVVGRLVDERFQLRVGYQRLSGIQARTLVVSFGGVLGASEPADFAAVRAAIDGVLADGPDGGGADVVLLQKTNVAAPWFAHLEGTGARSRRLVRPDAVLWASELPESWDALLSARSAKSRRQIRYDDNKLRRAYDGRLELRKIAPGGTTDLAEQDRLVADMQTIAGSSYQRGLGVSVVDNPLQAALLRTARERGWLRLWVLYIDDRAAAFWWGIVRGGVLSIGSPGFLPDFAKDRVGYYTLRRMIEDACADPEISTIDYGPGDADYKERFGTQSARVADVLLFARRPRPLSLHGLLRGQDRAVALAKKAVEKGGRTDELRRRWRARLAARSTKTAPDAARDD